MKTSKNSQNSQKSKTELGSVLLPRERKTALVGVQVEPSFVSAVESAAAKMGLTKSNFVRLAVARAVREAGVEIDDAEAVSYRGKQSAPKKDVEASAAGARAVRRSKQAGTPENARRLELLALGYCEDAVAAYLYAKAKAEKFSGRALAPAEDAEFISSAAARVAESSNPYGVGPPNF